MKDRLTRWLPGPAARIRAGGAAILLVLLALLLLQAPWTERLQSAWFDFHQLLLPRQVGALPVTVVEIDQKSLLALGQWPWPRSDLARLVRTLQTARPATIGLDILMPEADALSAERLLTQPVGRDPVVAAALRELPANDTVLADAVAAAPTVLVMVGSPDATTTPLRTVPVTVRDVRGPQVPAAPLAVVEYEGVLRSIEVLDSRAAGHGLISVETSRGVVRRMALLARIHGTLVPSLALEMVRVAEGAGVLKATASGSRVLALQAGHWAVSTEADGAVRPYFSAHRAGRFVSAIDVLEGRIDPARLQGHQILVGLTALGLQDVHDTPGGVRLTGLEIHAQLLENLLDGTLLRRPPWAPAVEALVLLLLGGWMVWQAPRTTPVAGVLGLAAAVLLPAGAGLLAFRYAHVLIDTATPGLYLMVLGGGLLALTLAASIHQRQQLQRQVQAQREDSARMGGELQAAQRIQTASLPRGDLLDGEPRVQLKAAMTPAREVGGDLYDYFMLDEDRLFLMIGDVAGKGLSASIFMAVSKALVKSAMLRAPQADLGALMMTANAEISRDNPQMLFVSLVAAVLDLRSGLLQYCNAGHDNPFVLRPPTATLGRIEDGDGPPLGTLADYPYRGASRQLEPGELLCLVTDGVVDAQDAAGHRFGLDRVVQVFGQASQGRCTAAELVQSLHGSVLAFAAGAEPADDLTILAVRWQGAGSPS